MVETTTLMCSKDRAPMRSIERNGMVIERCTECGGLFLDRGEFERLLQAEQQFYAPTATERAERDDDDAFDADDDRGRGPDGKRRKRRRGFLGELLDFG